VQLGRQTASSARWRVADEAEVGTARLAGHATSPRCYEHLTNRSLPLRQSGGGAREHAAPQQPMRLVRRGCRVGEDTQTGKKRETLPAAKALPATRRGEEGGA